MPELPSVIPVSRNNVITNFVPTAYKRGKKAEEGLTYYAIDQAISLEDLIKYYGQDEAKNELLARCNLRSQGWYESATTSIDEAGNEIAKPFDEQEFTKYASEFSARGLSKDDIQEAIKSCWEDLHALLLDPSVSPEDKNSKAMALSERVKSLNMALAAKKRDRTEAVAAPA
jgi:hypothetical protein